MNKKFIKVTKSKAYWSNKKTPHAITVTNNTLTHMIEWLIDNTYITIGNQVLRQTLGIPMGTDCMAKLIQRSRKSTINAL